MSLRRATSWTATAAVYAAAAAVLYALKAHFSAANADALRWVLAPTCWLAGSLGGIAFTDEAGAGFISYTDRLVVGPACSGLNFLIICFGALFFSLAHRLQGARRRALWLVTCLVLAYAATVLTNAVRVTLAGRLFQLSFEGGAPTQARLHRLMGTVLYCVSLIGVHRIADRWTDARRALETSMLSLPPLAWYVGVTLVVPLPRRPSLSDDARFTEHAASVIGAVVLLGALTVLANARARQQRSRRIGQPRRLLRDLQDLAVTFVEPVDERIVDSE